MNHIILRGEKTQEKEPENKKEMTRGMITRSRALLDYLEEDSSNSEDKEGNHLLISEKRFCLPLIPF